MRAWLLVLGALAGCAPSVPAIALDVDACDFCRMLITDARYAAAATDAGGRTVRFDSIECLAGWVLAEDVPPREVWVTDVAADTLIPVSAAAFHRTAVGSPMAGGWVAERRDLAAAGSIGWASLLAVVRREGMPTPGLPTGAGR